MNDRTNAAIALMIVLGSVPRAVAAQAPTEEAATSRSATFQAVEGPNQEQVPGGKLLVYAYGLILVLVLAYILRVRRMQDATAAELTRLSKAVDQAGKR